MTASGPPSETARMDLYKAPAPFDTSLRLLPLLESFFHGTMALPGCWGAWRAMGVVRVQHAVQWVVAVRRVGWPYPEALGASGGLGICLFVGIGDSGGG